jgi:hypothetical protein
MSATAEKTDGAALIDLRAAFSAAGIEEFLAALDRDLVRLKPVKARIREIASLPLIERVRQRLGFTTDTPTLHTSFTGNPGTGKTTVALGPVQAKMLMEIAPEDILASRVFKGVPESAGPEHG